jgi:hypothetical protein
MATLKQTIDAGKSQEGKKLVSTAELNEIRNLCDLDDEGDFVVISNKVVTEAGKIGYTAEEVDGGFLFTAK